jgi:hypothetical protein
MKAQKDLQEFLNAVESPSLSQLTGFVARNVRCHRFFLLVLSVSLMSSNPVLG